jgi:hypothetical protein
MFNEDDYDEFAKRMEEKYPEMYGNPYGGFAVGPGWWPIIESLSSQINSHVKWKNSTREALLKDNPHNHKIPDYVEPVKVAQIKEKFGGLRFYYDGGDEQVYGMVRMAESWAAHSCEECGKPGEMRTGGWIKTLCDAHEEIRQEKNRERFGKENGLEL